MTDYSELKWLAKELMAAQDQWNEFPLDSENGELWSAANDRFSDVATPEAVLDLIADNERLRQVTQFDEAVACVFDCLKIAAANTSDSQWDGQLEDLAEEVIECSPQYKREWKSIVSLSAERDQLKAEVEALRQQVANLSPFKGAPLTGPDLRCLACGGHHYGMENLPCPKMRAMAQSALSMERQRIVPAPNTIAGPHPIDAAMSKDVGQ